MKKIGVIIPVYNSAKTLDQCLNSIIKQTYSNILIFIVENGSTDNSYDKCLDIAKSDNRIIVLRSEKGVSRARNAGLCEAEKLGCEYVGFVDADDYIDEDMYEKLYFAAENEDAQIIFCNFVVEMGDKQDPQIITPKAKEYLKKGNITPFIYNDKNRMMGSVFRCLFRKDIYSGIRFQEDIILAEDLIFVLNAVKTVEKIGFIDDCSYHYMKPMQGECKKYWCREVFDERERFVRAMDDVFSKKEKSLAKIIRINTLIDMLNYIIKTEKNYKEKIAELYDIPFYKNECRSLSGLMQFLVHCCKSLKRKISTLMIYFGMYDMYKKISSRSHASK